MRRPLEGEIAAALDELEPVAERLAANEGDPVFEDGANAALFYLLERVSEARAALELCHDLLEKANAAEGADDEE